MPKTKVLSFDKQNKKGGEGRRHEHEEEVAAWPRRILLMIIRLWC